MRAILCRRLTAHTVLIDRETLVHELARRGLSTDDLRRGGNAIGRTTISKILAGRPVTPAILRKITATLESHPVRPVASRLVTP